MESKKRLAGMIVGGALVLAALGAGGVGFAYALTPATHPTVSVTQSHQISSAAQEDTQLAAATARSSIDSQQQIEAEKIAAEEAAAAVLAAQQAAEAQAAADAAAQAQAVADAQVADDSGSSSDTSGSSEPASSGEPSGTPLPMVQVTDPNNGQYGQMVIGVDPASWCASGSGTTRDGQPQCT